MWIWLIIILGSVVFDQVSKILVEKFLQPVGSVSLIDGVFRFTYVRNEGAAFGMLDDHRWVFMVISSVAIIVMLVYLWKFRPDSKWACTAIAMIIGGGIGTAHGALAGLFSNRMNGHQPDDIHTQRFDPIQIQA